MSKFKMVFEVQDETGKPLVERSQTWVELSAEDLARESPSEAIAGATASIARFLEIKLRELARETWIEREFAGYGLAMRRKDDPPIPGEPFMSMAEAKELTRRAVAEFCNRQPKS